MKKISFLFFLFFTSSSFAIMVSDFDNVCGNYKYDKIYAVFKINSYTCDSGYFLPAATAGCAACPDGYSCPGGTYTYNPMHAQGLIQNAEYYTANENNACAANFPHNLIAVFVENINCDAGQYLPANTNTCVECPAGNACPGGSYSFNAPIDQGIQSCAGTGFAPDKSAVCYPHLMHVGDDIIYLRSTKSTTPSLNVKIGNDIFYANMSSTRTKMNKDSAHYFRARWENNDYYICDDTTCPQ